MFEIINKRGNKTVWLLAGLNENKNVGSNVNQFIYTLSKAAYPDEKVDKEFYHRNFIIGILSSDKEFHDRLTTFTRSD